VLECHVGLRLETDAGTEDVGESIALLGQSVDDGRSGRCHGCLPMLDLIYVRGLDVNLP
jgi:hypothetical protein